MVLEGVPDEAHMFPPGLTTLEVNIFAPYLMSPTHNTQLRRLLLYRGLFFAMGEI